MKQLKFLMTKKEQEVRLSIGYKKDTGEFHEVCYMADKDPQHFLQKVKRETTKIFLEQEPKIQRMVRYSQTKNKITLEGCTEVPEAMIVSVKNILNEKIEIPV